MKLMNKTDGIFFLIRPPTSENYALFQDNIQARGRMIILSRHLTDNPLTLEVLGKG